MFPASDCAGWLARLAAHGGHPLWVCMCTQRVEVLLMASLRESLT